MYVSDLSNVSAKVVDVSDKKGAYSELRKNIFISLGISIFLFPWYGDFSLWIGVLIGIAIFVINDMCFRIKAVVAFSHIAVLLATLQLGIMPWLSIYFPPDNETYSIGNRLSIYLSYAGPAILSFSVGVFTSYKILQAKVDGSKKIAKPFVGKIKQIAKELDILIAIGFAAAVLIRLTPLSLKFAMVLLSNVAFVGVFGYLLLHLPGWKIRPLIVFVLIFVKSLEYGMFHDLALWSLSSVLILGYSRQWNKRKMLSIVLAGIFGLLILLNVKQEYRNQFWFGTEFIAETRIEAFSTLVINILSDPMVLFSEGNMSETILRLNQGWIVNQTMIWTPEFESFADGETITSSIIGAVVPRVLYPKKSVVGGKDDYERFTGRRLVPGTSMNLGYAGEMYANFGTTGGIIGVGIYGLLIGLGFQWFYQKAAITPLWWAWAAFFAGIAIKAESSIGYVANWLIKSVVIMIAILWWMPTLRKTLGIRLPMVK